MEQSEHEGIRGYIPAGSKELQRLADSWLGSLFLIWGILWLIGYQYPIVFGLTFMVPLLFPVLGWLAFRFVVKRRYCCPCCRKGWSLEQVSVVVSSGKCPHCLTLLRQADADEPAANLIAPHGGGKVVTKLSLAIFPAVLIWYWLHLDWTFLYLPDGWIFSGMGWYCLWLYIFYRFNIMGVGAAGCPHCRNRIDARLRQCCYIFGHCPHCGGKVGEELSPLEVDVIKNKTLERPMTRRGTWLVVGMVLFVVTGFFYLNMFAHMTPRGEPNDWPYSLLEVAVFPALVVLLLELWKRLTVRCPNCDRVTDRDIVSISGRCGNCGEKFYTNRLDARRKRWYIKYSIQAVLALIVFFGIPCSSYIHWEWRLEDVARRAKLCAQKRESALKEYAAYLTESAGGRKITIIMPGNYKYLYGSNDFRIINDALTGLVEVKYFPDCESRDDWPSEIGPAELVDIDAAVLSDHDIGVVLFFHPGNVIFSDEFRAMKIFSQTYLKVMIFSGFDKRGAEDYRTLLKSGVGSVYWITGRYKIGRYRHEQVELDIHFLLADAEP